MIKRLLASAFLFSSLVNLMSAQSLTLSNFNNYVSETGNLAALESHVTITNQSANQIGVMVERTIINLVPNQDEYFCFGLSCYAPGTAVSTSPGYILAGKDVDFKAAVSPNGNCGTTILHYKMYNQNNIADSVGIDLSFGFCVTGLADVKETYGISSAIRNPADGLTAFNYNIQQADGSDKLVIYNMLGSCVKTFEIPGNKGTLVVTTSDLKSGMYLVSYVSGSQVKSTSRLIVKH